MSTNTTNAAYGKAVDGDNAKTYLETTLGSALDKIDAHDHSGTTKNLAIPYGSISAVAATTFTPVLTQGVTPTLSTTVGRYIQIGKIVFVWVRVIASSAGTATSAIAITGLPVAAQAAAGYASGSAAFARAGLFYNLSAAFASTTSVQFIANAGTTWFGTNPAVTIASGDEIDVTLVYEAA